MPKPFPFDNKLTKLQQQPCFDSPYQTTYYQITLTINMQKVSIPQNALIYTNNIFSSLSFDCQCFVIIVWNDRLKMHIETEMEYYNSGSSIQGAVFIEALENFRFDALYIRIEGDEWCQWFEGSSKNRVKYTGNQNFYCMEYLLDKYDDCLLPTGKYVYPFSIELSDNIPGSFQSSKYDAKIQYRLVAYFIHYKKADRSQMSTLPLIIREPFRQDIVSYHGISETNPVSCRCFGKGEVKLQAFFDRNVCMEGEKIKVKIVVDNENGEDSVSEILLKLVQYTFISANNGVSRTYKHTIGTPHKVGRRIEKGQKKEFIHNLDIPEISHQTAISTLVANYYRLEVTTSMGMFSSENPSIYSPLFIMKKSFKMKKEKAKPSVSRQISRNAVQKPAVLFRAPEYWFRKNKNLSVMNFKEDEIVQLFSKINQ